MSKNSFFTRGRILSVLIVLALLVAMIPQTALAQTSSNNCSTFYTWKRGDTTGAIAHTYSMRWHKIAVANNLAIGEKPNVGDKVCIPKVSTASSGNTFGRNPKALFTAAAANGRLTINTSGFNNRTILKVKVHDAATGVGGWSNLGTISMDKGDNLSTVFQIPKDLRGKGGFLAVCLKDQINDDLVCRNVPNQ